MSTESSAGSDNHPSPGSFVYPGGSQRADFSEEPISRTDRAAAVPGMGSATPTRSSGSTAQPQSDAAGSVSQEMILETRNQIRALVNEITELTESNCDRDEFFAGFLTRCVQALASIGGAIWKLDELGISLEYQINLVKTDLADGPTRGEHDAAVARMLEEAEPGLIAPQSGSDQSDGVRNPTDHLLVVAPLVVNEKTVGLVEIFQRADAGPATQRGYLRFLVQMVALANHYLQRRELREFSDRQQMWHTLDRFIRDIHCDLDTPATLYALANEGRRVIQCDRVSVALKRGSQFRVQAVSGLDSIERRADQVKLINQLAQAVAPTGETLWYCGDDDQLPPQIEERLHAYVDLAHAKVVGVIPLRRLVVSQEPGTGKHPAAESEQAPGGPIIGMLICEQLTDDTLTDSLKRRSHAVAEHGSYALSNSLEHNSILWAGLWKRLGQLAAVTYLRNLPKTLTVMMVVLGLVGVFCLMPYPFTLGSTGTLVPETVHEVFARYDGVLVELNVPDEETPLVEQGQVLARMENNELLVEIKDLQGQLDQAEEAMQKFNRIRNSNGLSDFELRQAEADLNEAYVRRQSLLQQLDLKLDQLEAMEVRAPASGVVINWKLRDNLLRRPVQRGQNLMTIVDPHTEWNVELELPERRTVHLLQAMRDQPEVAQIPVTFTLASHPGSQFRGHLTRLDRRLDVHSDDGNSLRVRVSFDESQVPRELLRDGTRVTAKIELGTRSFGYVWLHELFETVQSSVLFWF